jgi:hypothetical protein
MEDKFIAKKLIIFPRITPQTTVMANKVQLKASEATNGSSTKMNSIS